MAGQKIEFNRRFDFLGLSFKTDQLNQWALILFSALLVVLSFPKVSWSLLAWVSLVPFLKSLENKPAGTRFRLGYLFGLLYNLGIFSWVTHSMRYYGGLDPITSYLILLLMVLYLALYAGTFGWLWGLFPSKGFFPLLWAPSIWVGLEFLRAHLLTGFPWELFGYSQYNLLPIIQIAEITGVLGVSFLIILINQTLYQLFLADRPHGKKSRRWKEGVLPILLVILVLIFGLKALSQQRRLDRQAPSIKVAVIQGNIDQSLKWDPSFQEKTINLYEDLTLKTGSSPLDLVIWPETAVPFYFLGENRLSPRLFQLTQKTGAHLLFGSPAFNYRGGQPQFYNRAYLLSPEGRISFYDKVHLVPFGEYVPLKKWLPFVGKMVQAIGDFSPGPGSNGLPHPKGKLGVLICFETIFPELSRAYNQEGCRLLVNMTNDAWFGKTSAPFQHLSMLTFRAVENRLWVARAANTGFSAIIDSTGLITNRFPLFKTGGIYANIPLRGERTFYSRHGDLLIIFCGLVFLSGIIFWIVKKRGL